MKKEVPILQSDQVNKVITTPFMTLDSIILILLHAVPAFFVPE